MSYEVIQHSTDEQNRPIVNLQGVVLDHAQTVKLRDELNRLLAPAVPPAASEAEKSTAMERLQARRSQARSDAMVRRHANAGNSSVKSQPAGEAAHTLNVSRPKADALAQFLSDPSPAKAVALAIADHRAGKLVDWPFIDALVKAQAACNSHAALVAALEYREMLEAMRNSENPPANLHALLMEAESLARAALNAAKEGSK